MALAMAIIQLALSRHKFKSHKPGHVHSLVDAVAAFLHNGFISEEPICPKPNRGTHCKDASILGRGRPPRDLDANSCASLLLMCTDMTELKQLHAHVFVTGLEQNIVFATKLVNLYGTCGSLECARQVFDEIPERNVFSWNAMIGGYARNGSCEEVLMLFHQMRLEGMQPDSFTFPFVLKACGALSALQEGRKVHCHTIKTGFDLDVIVGTALVDMYAKCKSVDGARQVFDKMSERDVVSWNAMIAGYNQSGHACEALDLFNQMQLTDMLPNSVTFLSVLPSCSHLTALQQGKRIHAYAMRSGFESCVSVGKALIDMYAKCKATEIARQLFDKMPNRDAAAWGGMISGYAQNGCAHDALMLFRQMQLADMKLDSVILVSVLLACTDLECVQWGKDTHGYIVKNGFGSDVSVQTTLVTMYCRCGSIDVACQLFDKMSKRDVVSWSAMIGGYAQNGYAREALTLFHQMQLASLEPNRVTIASVLPACAELEDLQQGKDIHDYVIKNRLESDVSVATALVAMYAKCGSIDIARQTFDKMSKKDVASWNAMIAGYAQNGYASEALALFHQMQQADVQPDSVTMVSVLPACAHLAALQEGKWVHDYINRSGFGSDVSVGNALIDMYAKCGTIEIASQLFQKISKRDVVSWNAMIAGYTQNGLASEALMLFRQMQRTDVPPNLITVDMGFMDVARMHSKYFSKCNRQAQNQTASPSHLFCLHVDIQGWWKRAGNTFFA